MPLSSCQVTIMLYSEIEKAAAFHSDLSVNVRTLKVRRWRHLGNEPRCKSIIP